MTTTPTLIQREQLYIGGEWVKPASQATIEVVNAATEEVMGSVPEGTPERRRPRRGGRAGGLRGLERHAAGGAGRPDGCRSRAGLQERQEEIAGLIAQELGSPITLAMMIQAGLPIMDFGSMQHLAEHIPWEQQIGNSLIVREPVGVVGAITPWNYPLHQIAAKVAPAMVAGCTVVLKPSEVTPLNAFVLAEIFDEVGVPAGVLEPRHRLRARGRRGDRRPPGRRHGLVHRVHPRRPARQRARRGHRQEGRPRARRQVPEHHPRRRRPREGRRQRDPEVLPELRPDLLGADPHARARARSSSWPSRSPPRRPRRPSSASPSTRPRSSARWSPTSSVSASAATSAAASRRARSSSAAAPSRPRASTTATSCSRPCSATSRPR